MARDLCPRTHLASRWLKLGLNKRPLSIHLFGLILKGQDERDDEEGEDEDEDEDEGVHEDGADVGEGESVDDGNEGDAGDGEWGKVRTKRNVML